MPTTYPATPNQQDFIVKLLKERDGFTLEFAARVEEALKTNELPKSKASEIIDFLLAKPMRAGTSTATGNAPYPKVPAGHYAVTSATGNNDLDFFRVDSPTEGKWKGYSFVKRVVGGHPEYDVKGATAKTALEAIVAAGVDASAKLYGTKIGRCYVCNRTLTDELSRSLGIGPVCRGEATEHGAGETL
jgi:hypothetical protein